MAEHPAVAFLLAAHQRAEALARAGTPDPWTVHLYDWTSSFDASIGHHFEADVVGGSREGGGVEYLADAEFIVANSPGTVLRRVAAERELLAEHQLFRREVPVLAGDCFCCAKPLPTEPFEMTWCGTCHDEDDVGYEARWHGFRGGPCRTVLLLAEAWGWTEGASC